MIQRSQTIYLGLAFLCMALLLFFPIFSIELRAAEGEVMANAVFGKDGLVGEGLPKGKFNLSYFIISLAMVSFATLLMYKKRPRQLLMARLNLVLHVIFVVGIYLIYFFGNSLLADGLQDRFDTTVNVIFFMGVGFFLMIPSLAFIFLAIRGIKRDENLVNSLDRLR